MEIPFFNINYFPHFFLNFLTFPCNKETNGVNMYQVASASFTLNLP